MKPSIRLLVMVWVLISGRAAEVEFIDTSFENASPLWYDFAEDGTVRVHLLYDHERSSPNRAAGHIHFRMVAKAGAKVSLEFLNLDNVWNGTPGSVARELKAVVVSEDGKNWRSVATESLATNRVKLKLTMPLAGRDAGGPSSLFVARVEPYRISDLEKFLKYLRAEKLAEVSVIGKTVQGRDLEIVRIGNAKATHRVFLRARAHPWEPVGNWVLEGLARRLLKGDEEAKKFLERYCVYFMPMANKDGVALGRTRFNLLGKDLNRNWDKPVDRELAPENFALEQWLEKMIAAGEKPELALELHNDGNGKLHVSRPTIADLQKHLERMERLEKLLRKHTWFTEGATGGDFRNSGTLGEGWTMRYGITAAVHEFNCNWIAGRNDFAGAKYWREYGEGLCVVFFEYFGE